MLLLAVLPQSHPHLPTLASLILRCVALVPIQRTARASDGSLQPAVSRIVDDATHNGVFGLLINRDTKSDEDVVGRPTFNRLMKSSLQY